MVRISNIQLFMLVVVFIVGSTTLFALGIGAGRDAWIVMLLEALAGAVVLWVYTQFPKWFPHQTFAHMLKVILGKKLGIPLLALYCFYFYNQVYYNFYEFGALIKLTTLELTPILVILYIFIFAMIYMVYLGFEVIARTCEILLPYLLFFLLIIFILASLSEGFDMTEMLPILGEGYKPIFEEWRVSVGFPYGEVVVFLTFWHYVDKHEHIRKVTFWALGVSTFFVVLSLIVMISMLGPELTGKTEIPLLETILAIKVAEIITNLDSLAVFIIFIGGFYKTILHFMGFYLTFTWLVKSSKVKWLFFVISTFYPIISYYRFPGLDIQRWIGPGDATYIVPIFACLPIFLLIIGYLKRKRKGTLTM
jgi:spore germination protein KB